MSVSMGNSHSPVAPADIWASQTSDVWVYDPMLDPVDITLLESTGFKIANKNHVRLFDLDRIVK